jgi:hypothetical protein
MSWASTVARPRNSVPGKSQSSGTYAPWKADEYTIRITTLPPRASTAHPASDIARVQRATRGVRRSMTVGDSFAARANKTFETAFGSCQTSSDSATDTL